MSAGERAFVAGATGYTGRAVVAELRRRGIETHAHVRADSPRGAEARELFASLGARVDGSPWEQASLARRITELAPSLVFALLGTTRARAAQALRAGAPPESYESVDYGLSACLLAAVLDGPSRPRFVYLSSAGVRSDSASRYLAARARLEALLRTSGIPFTIARPSVISGPDREEDRPAERLAAALLDACLAGLSILGARRLAARYRSIDATTLARGLVRAALDPACAGRVLRGEDLRER